MKQNVTLQNMISNGMIGQRNSMSVIAGLENQRVSAVGRVGFMKQMSLRLDEQAIALDNEKITLMTAAERIKQSEIMAGDIALGKAQQQVDIEIQRFRIMGMASSMTQHEAEVAMNATNSKLQASLMEEESIRGIIALKGSSAMIDGVSASEAIIAAEMKTATLEEEYLVLTRVAYAQQELSTKEQFEIGILNQETTARIKQIQQKREEFIQTINLLKATGHLTAEEYKNIMATMNQTKARQAQSIQNQHTVGSLISLDAATMKAAFSTQRLSAASSIASMALMMFGDSEDAMQASMVLMVVSMMPAIMSMVTMKNATDAATASSMGFQAVTTGGLALLVAGGAWLAAKHLFKNSAEEMQMATDSVAMGFEDVQVAAGDFAFELDKPGGAADLMLDFGNTTAESMDKAESSVKSFMSAREELFFGFSASRMNQTLFEQLVNQGVGELYYRTEVNVNNNFYGLTVDEIVQQITVQVEEAVIARAG